MSTLKASLLSVPPEIRAVIFHHLFRNSRIFAMRWLDGSCQWKPSDFDARHTMNIFYTCRCLYEEARLMFALRAKLIHSDMRLAGIPRSIQEYYYPRIRKVTVDSNLTATALDFAPFVSLEQLKICEPPLKASRYIKEMIPSSWDDVGGQECLEGSMDAKFKQAARTYCLNTMESTWVRDLLLDPTRSFKMVTPIIAVWPVGRSTAEYGGRLTLKCDLDTLNTMMRRVSPGLIRRPYKVWKGGSITTWTAPPGVRGSQLESVKPWLRNEQDNGEAI